MQVTSKDSKHLFSLDNLLDFLHKKADITDCLKQHRSLWRIHDTCFIMKMKWGRKNTCGNGTERNKDCDKETRKRENWRNITVWAFLLKWITLYFLLVYWVHQWWTSDIRVQQTFTWLSGSQDRKRWKDNLPGFSFALFLIVQVFIGEDVECVSLVCHE